MAQSAPGRSVPQASVTKLSRQWHFGVAIFVVPQCKIFSCNPLLAKLWLYGQTTGNLTNY